MSQRMRKVANSRYTAEDAETKRTGEAPNPTPCEGKTLELGLGVVAGGWVMAKGQVDDGGGEACEGVWT